MKSDTFINISILFIIYVVASQLLMGKYKQKIEDLKKTNTDTVRACIHLNEGEDFEENHL